ncbi:MAG: protein kinase [Minicystis sp.]
MTKTSAGSPAHAAEEPAEGALVGGRYRLVRVLAHGGMGTVWIARDTQLARDVAVKFLGAHLAGSAKARRRFEREARAAARLASPHVVRIFDHGVAGEAPYLVMELLEGEDLGVHLRREGRLPLPRANAILAQVARGLGEAHQSGVVHRDLKPGNLFLARAGSEEVVKILDFGIAKTSEAMPVDESTRTGELLGSPRYMSPEQVAGDRNLDHRSDLWALGAILFRVVTGAYAFTGPSVGAVGLAICTGPLPVASASVPELPPAIDCFFARAFERDREKRFQSAHEMADAFAGAIGARSEEPLAAAPGPEWIPLAGGGADLSQQLVVMGERRLRLTTKERDLLAYLARRPGRTVTRQELVVEVWGNPAQASHEPVYSVVKRLRAKIDGGAHRHIVAVHGDGYRWAPPPAAPEVPSAAARPGSGGLDEDSGGEHRRPAAARSPGAVARPRFFGREVELRAAAEAFDAGARLVTLVGPGGAGKTRCALELCAGRDHVLCDLSSAYTEASVVAAVAAALGVPLDGADTADGARGVGRALGARPDRLVVLDNTEQAIDAVAALVGGWLAGRPTLLVTSREPLRIAAERVIPLGPLAPAEAEALFADRVAAAGGDPGSAAVQARIVERVDRLPLAIELAAAQVPGLGPEALLDSLDAQLATLVAGPRDAPPRHASLRAAVAWSWTFLGERERDALRRLSVLGGPFTMAAARAVDGGGDVVAVLAALCRRCQVRREGDRFALYAAVRELAREDAGDLGEVQARHAAHFVRAGEEAASLLEGPRHAEGAAALAADLGELHRAWSWARGGDAVLAARLAIVLDRALGLQSERAGARRELLAQSREGLTDAGLTCALLLAEGRLEGAPAALLDRAAALAEGPRIEAEIRLARGERLAAVDLAAARAEQERALALATEAGAGALRGRVLAALGEVAWAHGLVTEASARLRAALAVHLEAGDRRAAARTAALLAHVDRLETGGGAARDLLRLAETAAAELGEPVTRARVLLDLGQHLTRTGDQAGARAALGEAAAIYERVGFERDRAFLHLHVAETLVGVGDLDEALREAHRALIALTDAGAVGRSTIHEAIGCIHLLRGDLSQAERWIRGRARARAAERRGPIRVHAARQAGAPPPRARVGRARLGGFRRGRAEEPGPRLGDHRGREPGRSGHGRLRARPRGAGPLGSRPGARAPARPARHPDRRPDARGLRGRGPGLRRRARGDAAARGPRPGAGQHRALLRPGAAPRVGGGPPPPRLDRRPRGRAARACPRLTEASARSPAHARGLEGVRHAPQERSPGFPPRSLGPRSDRRARPRRRERLRGERPRPERRQRRHGRHRWQRGRRRAAASRHPDRRSPHARRPDAGRAPRRHRGPHRDGRQRVLLRHDHG